MVDNILDRYFYQESQHHQMGICYPNVGDVFSAGGQVFNRDINAHYGQRLPRSDNRNIGVITEQPSANVLEQWQYMSRVTGKTITVLPPLESLNGAYQGLYVYTYINPSSVEEKMHQHGLKVWGLPGKLVDVLKNKARCHSLIDQLQIPGFEVPDYRIAEVDQLAREASPFVDKIRANYQKVNMPEYSVGVMIRGAESGGNYGACFVKESDQAIKFVPNGETAEAEYYPTWDQALDAAQHYLKNTSNADTTIEPRVVMSRFMDLADSPGMSSFMRDGQIVHFGWNGQLTSDQESSACIGTSSYRPATAELRTWQNNFEASSEVSFGRFLHAAIESLGLDPQAVYGFANVDWMIPGPLEQEYQKRQGRQAGLSVAEINPRFTSWTDAVSLVAEVNGQPRTPRVFQELIQKGVESIDKFPMTDHIPVVQGLAKIEALDESLKVQGSRVIIRMRDSQPGLVISGNLDLVHDRLADLKIA